MNMLSKELFLQAVFASFLIGSCSASERKRPNVVFVLTDDQDAKLNSLDYMPSVQNHLIEKGTNFKSHYCTVAWCCPSRVSLWTGKTAHNTNVTNVAPPYGGYPKFLEQRLNESWVPLWLQDEGYQTYYVGKLMNHQNLRNYNDPFPSGFNGTDFLIEPNTYNYMQPIFQRNKEKPVLHNNTYSTDLIHEKSIGYLEDAAQKPESPFFLAIAPIAPHSDFQGKIDIGGDPPIGIEINPPVAAKRHEELFPDAQVPRGASFNPDTPSGVDWISDMPLLSPENITYNDHLYRQRLRSLQAVDEIVEDVVKTLEKHNILDNTYIFYSADNGYHIGQHRLPPGKGCGFEEDINVPLVVRGPGVPQGKTVDFATSHTDLAATWWKILGIPLRDDFDGAPIPLSAEDIQGTEASGKAREHIQIEFWALENPSEYGKEDVPANNTYKGVRIVSEGYGYYYSVWCSGSHELYDMKKDPSQMNNLLAPSSGYPTNSNDTSHTITLGEGTFTLSALRTRLDALILVLKTCKGVICLAPWDELLPGSGVATLSEALDSKFDEYFSGLPSVTYSACADGHIAKVEGPMWESKFSDSLDLHSMARRVYGGKGSNRP